MKSQVKPEYEAPGNSPKQDLLGSWCFTSYFPQKPSTRLLQVRSHENLALIPLVLIHVGPHSYLYAGPGSLLPSVFKIPVQQDPVLSLPAHISCGPSTGFIQDTNKVFGAGNIFLFVFRPHIEKWSWSWLEVIGQVMTERGNACSGNQCNSPPCGWTLQKVSSFCTAPSSRILINYARLLELAIWYSPLQNCFLWELLVMEDMAKMKWELANW